MDSICIHIFICVPGTIKRKVEQLVIEEFFCRRLLLDDSRGVAEALNETVCVENKCTGLIVSACGSS